MPGNDPWAAENHVLCPAWGCVPEGSGPSFWVSPPKVSWIVIRVIFGMPFPEAVISGNIFGKALKFPGALFFQHSGGPDQ
jgi:hypothetical protein